MANAAVYEDHRLPGYLGVVVLDDTGTMRYVTPALAHRYGWGTDEIVGRLGLEIIHPDDLEQAARSLAGTTERTGAHQPLSFRLIGGDGAHHEVVIVAQNLLGAAGIDGIVISVTDSAEFRRAEELALQQTQVLESIAGDAPVAETLAWIARLVEAQVPASWCVVTLADDDGLRVAAAPSVPRGWPGRHGAAGDRLVGDGLVGDGLLSARVMRMSEALVAPALPDEHLPATSRLAAALGAHAAWSLPVRRRREDVAIGTIDVYHADPVHPRPDEWSIVNAAARLAALAIAHDRRLRQLEHRAVVDAMTGLPNRRHIEEVLGELVEMGRPGGVVFLDIDRLKSVNDSLGHAVGDELIVAVAERLRELAGPGITPARFGGDEFVVVLDTPDPDTVERFADEALARLRAPFRLGHRRLSLRSSIGVVAVDRQRSAAAVLSDADAAMYAAKAAGRDRVVVFSPVMHAQAARQLEIETGLRTMLERGGPDVHFQPIVDARTLEIVGCEALARWTGPEGPLPPSEFVPVAEETGLVIPLGERVLLEACRTVRAVRHVRPRFRITVNVSPTQLHAGQIGPTVYAALDGFGLPPDALTLEITESTLMNDDRVVIEQLRAMREYGVGIAIDDFGTGYSSLAYLRSLPADVLKVDRRFVQDLADESGRTVTAAIIQLARGLGIRSVAEGVETEAQLAALQAMGVDAFQGFLVSRPRPCHELFGLLGVPLDALDAVEVPAFAFGA